MSDRAVIAKIGYRDGEPFVTAISIQADGHPDTAGRVLLDHYPLEADVDRLLTQGNLTTLRLRSSDAAVVSDTPTYGQPGSVEQLLGSHWLRAADPQWLYVHYEGHSTTMPVVERGMLQLLNLVID